MTFVCRCLFPGHIWISQFLRVEFLYHWVFDAWTSDCLDVEFGHKQPMARPSDVGDGACDDDISAASLSGDAATQSVQLLDPGCFQVVFSPTES